MTIESIAIPQADVLWDVARVAEAVDRGINTLETIGAYLGAKGPRQGHYYTQAARVLGLVGEITPEGRVTLTSYGQAFARYDRASQRHALRRLVRQCEPTRTVVETLRGNGQLGPLDVAQILQQIAPLADSTAQRRARTVSSWLVAAGLAAWRDGQLRYIPSAAPSGGFLRSL